MSMTLSESANFLKVLRLQWLQEPLVDHLFFAMEEGAGPSNAEHSLDCLQQMIERTMEAAFKAREGHHPHKIPRLEVEETADIDTSDDYVRGRFI